jgi:hypothetical protein
MSVIFRAVLLSVFAILLASVFFDTTYAARGDGLLLYGEGVVTTPRYRTWTNATNTLGAEQTGVAAAASIRHVITEPAPNRNETLAGIQTTGGVLYVQRWNGTAWSNEWNVTVGNGNLPKYDIAYERKSGRAIVFYSSNAASPNEIRYRTWDGTVWSGAQNFDPIRTTAAVYGIKAVSQKASNGIGLAWADTAFDLSASYWDGDTSAFTAEPSAALSTNLSRIAAGALLTNQSFDVAFENLSDEMLVVWGNDTVADLQYVTRGAGVGGAWGTTSTQTTLPEEPTDMQLVSEPYSDYIAYVNATDNGADGDAAMWTGGAWGNVSNYDAALDTIAAGTKNVSGAWVQNGAQSRFVLIYDDKNNAGIDWTVFNKNAGTWALQTDYNVAPSPASNNDLMLRMYTNIFSTDQAIAIVIDGAQDLFMKKLTFDGTTLTWASVEGGASPEATISVANGLAADFAYSRFITPAVLAADIVDASGSPVASPSITFNALTTSFSCQANSATLGTAAQKMRISNGTANELWTLSIAATGGAAANWSNGSTGQFDFNDTAGSPVGCLDGADADSLPGRMSVDASASTITALQYDCSVAGVTKGSLAGFSQGVTDAVTIANTSSSAIDNCDYDMTDVTVTQQVPAERPIGNYSINMTITVTAN